MDDLKLFVKNEDQIDSLVNTVKIFSEDIKMEFGLPKCGVLIMKRGKVVKSEGISMPNGKIIKNIEEGGCKYLGILEAVGVKHEEMKDLIRKEKHQKSEKYTKFKVKWRDITLAISSKAVIIRWNLKN